MLGGGGVRVDDLLVADLVRVLVVLQVVVRHERRRVVDASELAFLADLDLRRDRVDGRRGVVDVRDRPGRRHRLQVLVVDPVLHDAGLQGPPVVLRGDRHAREQLLDLLGLRSPLLLGVLVEELSRRVGRVTESVEGRSPLLGDGVRRTQRVEEHRVEVDVREVQALVGPVVDVLAGEVAVQVHLPQTDRVRAVVAVLDRTDGADVALVADGRERADRGVDGLAEVTPVHRQGDVHRPEVAGDVLADLVVRQIVVVGRRGVDLKDLRAQVGHVDPTLDRVGLVHRVLEHDVRVAGLELDLGDRLEELARVDLRLLDARIVDHLAVLLGDRDVTEGHPVDALDVVGREEVHVLAVLGELERDVRHDHTQRQRLDADLLVGVLTLGVEEPHDVGVVGVEVDRTGTLTSPELVGVAEAVFEQLHDGDDAAGLILDLLDRCAGLADVRQQQRHAAAALGQLQSGVDAAGDRLHVVFDAQQEARDEFTALRLAGVEEGGRGGLEATGDDLLDQLRGQLLVAVGQTEGGHHDAVFEAFEVALAVEGLQRVARVVLERTQEGLEPELARVGEIVELLDELERVLLEHGALVVLLVDQVVQPLLEGVEEHGVLVDMLQEVLPRGTLVRVELDVPVGVVQVQHRVEGVIILPLEPRVALEVGLGQCCFHHRSNPSLTRSMSSGVPKSSMRYKCGTRHLRLMMSPASPKCSPKLVFPVEMTPRSHPRLPSSLRNRMTCFGTAPFSSPRPWPPPYVGVIRTYGSSMCGDASEEWRGMRIARMPSFSTKRVVFPDTLEK